MNPLPGASAVFLDRDGTLIREKDYLADPEGVELLPGIPGALRQLRDAGYFLVVVTNQSGIARGYYAEEDYRAVAERLDLLLEEEDVPLDLTRHCPHHPDHGSYCVCRKPAVGMHLEAAAELGIDLSRSWYVGDKLSDVVPAEELGGRGILLRTGHPLPDDVAPPGDIPVVEDLPAAVRLILAETDSDGEGEFP